MMILHGKLQILDHILQILHQFSVNTSTTSINHFNNPLRTDGDFCHQGRDTEIAPNIFKSAHTDMTIHWKALEDHFLLLPLFF
jgi:hypothetical protein